MDSSGEFCYESSRLFVVSECQNCMRLTEPIESDIKARLGYIPGFLGLANESPGMMRSLWQQTLAGYLDNPLPERFKESLLVSVRRRGDSKEAECFAKCLWCGHRPRDTQRPLPKHADKV